jgi:hypothetical protein
MVGTTITNQAPLLLMPDSVDFEVPSESHFNSAAVNRASYKSMMANKSQKRVIKTSRNLFQEQFNSEDVGVAQKRVTSIQHSAQRSIGSISSARNGDSTS